MICLVVLLLLFDLWNSDLISVRQLLCLCFFSTITPCSLSYRPTFSNETLKREYIQGAEAEAGEVRQRRGYNAASVTSLFVPISLCMLLVVVTVNTVSFYSDPPNAYLCVCIVIIIIIIIIISIFIVAVVSNHHCRHTLLAVLHPLWLSEKPKILVYLMTCNRFLNCSAVLRQF